MWMSSHGPHEPMSRLIHGGGRELEADVRAPLPDSGVCKFSFLPAPRSYLKLHRLAHRTQPVDFLLRVQLHGAKGEEEAVHTCHGDGDEQGYVHSSTR